MRAYKIIILCFLLSACGSKTEYDPSQLDGMIGSEAWYSAVHQLAIKDGGKDISKHEIKSEEWLDAIDRLYGSQGESFGADGPDVDSSEWKSMITRKIMAKKSGK